MEDNRLRHSVSEILSKFLGMADSLSLVVRDEYQNCVGIHKVLNKLSVFLIEKVSDINEWPGTTLLLGTATIYKYHFSLELITVLSGINDDLYDWISPDLPEDIIVYSNGNPLFVSITHERDSYYC